MMVDVASFLEGWPQWPQGMKLNSYLETACVLEVLAEKPGNVHPRAAFLDTSVDDFVRSAVAIGPVFERAARLTVGELILSAVRATREIVGKNTNLGIVLLLAPLAKAESPTRSAVGVVLDALSVRDAELAYEAIRLAAPGGLGRADEHDVAECPTMTLLEAMRLATDRDLIARQYATQFADVFEHLLPDFQDRLQSGLVIEQAIIGTFLFGLSTLGDTLILRKCGMEMFEQSKRLAMQVLASDWPHSFAGRDALARLDAWLRGDGHRRNPGAMADLMAATLFLALWNGTITISLPWMAPPLD